MVEHVGPRIEGRSVLNVALASLDEVPAVGLLLILGPVNHVFCRHAGELEQAVRLGRRVVRRLEDEVHFVRGEAVGDGADGGAHRRVLGLLTLDLRGRLGGQRLGFGLELLGAGAGGDFPRSFGVSLARLRLGLLRVAVLLDLLLFEDLRPDGEARGLAVVAVLVEL